MPLGALLIAAEHLQQVTCSKLWNLLQKTAVSSRAASGKKLAGIDLAASGFATNCLNLRGPQ